MGGGVTETVPEPELDWIDAAILAGWWRLNRDLCTLCGRPLALHDDDAPEDYTVAFRTCTATVALSRQQAQQDRDDERARDNGEPDPDRPRTWLAWTDAEGAPLH